MYAYKDEITIKILGSGYVWLGWKVELGEMQAHPFFFSFDSLFILIEACLTSGQHP